jgi:acetylornithine/succinyldiaminopimelate/putrescine aminotransferase
VRLAPPLVIDREQIDIAVAAMARVLAALPARRPAAAEAAPV